MPVDFWNQNVHPITMYKIQKDQYALSAKKAKVQINYLKGEFNPILWVETKELMTKLNLSSNLLSVKIKELGYVKITYSGRKYVERTFEKEYYDYCK